MERNYRNLESLILAIREYTVTFSINYYNLKKLMKDNIMNINTIKWTSTFFILSGILMAQFELYPYYIFSHSIGAIGWLVSGYLMNDKAVMTNF